MHQTETHFQEYDHTTNDEEVFLQYMIFNNSFLKIEIVICEFIGTKKPVSHYYTMGGLNLLGSLSRTKLYDSCNLF